MNATGKILVCDDDEALCYLLKEQLVGDNFSVDIVYDGKYAIENIKKKTYDLLLLDLNMQLVSGKEVLRFVKENYPSLQVIVLTADSEIREAIDCIKLGAYDFLTKPYIFDDLSVTINRALEHKELVIKNELLTKQAKTIKSSSIIGNSTVLTELMTLAAKAAHSDSSILVEGETGTGKELLAEFIHKNSTRNSKPFVIINCASLPDQLIESELFGYERGAFTDAKTTKQGLVEFANGGTLFLDEIGEMSLTIQPKLLRFIETGEYRRVGGVNSLNSNVRIIGATNRNLIDEVDSKNFRRDLLFRLNVITLTMPPLRDRKEDILLLADHFLKVKSPVRSPKKLSEKAAHALVNYHFPGNVRELEHIIERSIIFSEDNVIKLENLFLPVDTYKSSAEEKLKPLEDKSNLLSMSDLEKIHIQRVLEANNWDRVHSAIQLGISQKTLYSKIKNYHLKKNEEQN